MQTFGLNAERTVVRSFGSAPIVSGSPGVDPRRVPYAPLHRVLNSNAAVDPTEYKQPHARSLGEYELGLLIDRSTIQPGDVVIDSGGAVGCAALELAIGRGANAVVINAQDFFSPVRAMLDGIRQGRRAVINIEHMGNGYSKLRSIGSFDAQEMRSFAVAAGLDDKPFVTAFASGGRALGAVQSLAQQMATRALDTIDSGRFTYRVAYAEEVLGDYAGRAKLITDFWGAFSYSPERVQLLELFYGALRPDGAAHIMVSHKVPTRVETPAGEKDLLDYLVERYPTIFDVQNSQSPDHSWSKVLIMRRDPNIPSLALNLVHAREPTAGTGDFAPPSVLLRQN